jgi:hypothetical protein
MGFKVQAVEYATPDGRARGWYTDCGRSGEAFAASAVLVPGLVDMLGHSAPWLVEVKYRGWYGHREIGHYRTLAWARMWALGGNGHVHRGHSSIASVRQMSRANVLALTAGPTRHAVTPERMTAPWR